jgi:hypothetical protein
MNDNEKIYDEQIAPLMSQIIEICKANNIPMFADFQYAKFDFCTTLVYPDVADRNVTMYLYNMLSKCREHDGVNIDKFFFGVSKKYPNKSSIVMSMLGNKPKST